MCLGSQSAPKPPKPPPLQPPIPAPPPPKPPAPPPKRLQEPDKKPDIRIGKSKAASTSRSTRSADRGVRGSQSLSIGNNQGMSL